MAASPTHANSGTSHIASGVAGVAAGAVFCGIDLTNASSYQDIDKRAFETNSHNHAMKQELAQEPGRAINYIKEFCYSHASWVPGGQHYLNTAFKDLETLKQSHKDEVDQIVNDVYEELQLVSTSGFSFKNVRKTFGIFASLSERLGELAGGIRPNSSAAST